VIIGGIQREMHATTGADLYKILGGITESEQSAITENVIGVSGVT